MSTVSTLIALPYELARLPWTVVDHRLAGRLSDTSPARLGLDKVLGSADRLAGQLLRNGALSQRGTDRLERSATLAKAAELEEQAQARRDQAAKTAARGKREAAKKRTQAQERAAAGLDEAEAAEARGKQEAAAAAAKTAATKKKAADKRAASRAKAAEERKAQADAAAEAEKKAAQEQATSELDAARESKQAADQARDDAQRLEQLTEAKKQERQAD